MTAAELLQAKLVGCHIDRIEDLAYVLHRNRSQISYSLKLVTNYLAVWMIINSRWVKLFHSMVEPNWFPNENGQDIWNNCVSQISWINWTARFLIVIGIWQNELLRSTLQFEQERFENFEYIKPYHRNERKVYVKLVPMMKIIANILMRITSIYIYQFPSDNFEWKYLPNNCTLCGQFAIGDFEMPIWMKVPT